MARAVSFASQIGKPATNLQRFSQAFFDQRTGQDEIKRTIATYARGQALNLVAQGRLSANYRVFINGVEGAENFMSLTLDGRGAIRYVGSNWKLVMDTALALAIQGSPILRGRFVRNWLFLVNDQPWTSTDYTLVPFDAHVTLVNSSDYARKFDVGAMETRKPPQLIDAISKKLMRQFPGYSAELNYITLPGGYILRGRTIRSGLHFDRKTRSFRRLHDPVKVNRADSRRGEVMTYPALHIWQPV